MYRYGKHGIQFQLCVTSVHRRRSATHDSIINCTSEKMMNRPHSRRKIISATEPQSHLIPKNKSHGKQYMLLRGSFT